MAGEERNIKVHIENVKKTYQGRTGEVVALNGVNLDIMDNEFITVVGPSGCGKSTILNIMAGLLEPTSGKIICNGKEVHGTGPDRGVVFQQYALFPWLTVKKNVLFPLQMKGIKGQEAEDIAMKYIKMVDLEKFCDHYPKELSGGFDTETEIGKYRTQIPQRSREAWDDPRIQGVVVSIDEKTKKAIKIEIVDEKVDVKKPQEA